MVVFLVVEFQEITIKLNGMKAIEKELKKISKNNLMCFNGFFSKKIIICTLRGNKHNLNYVVSYHFQHKNYYTFFNKELRKLL